MSNALNWALTAATHYVVHAPFAGGRTAVVDPADIGAVAAACLSQDGHEHQIYELTGPEPLSPPDQVDILGRVLGRALSYVEADPADVLHTPRRRQTYTDVIAGLRENLAWFPATRPGCATTSRPP